MLVLYWTSCIATASGRTLGFPIGVEDEDLDAFCDRLAREGGVMVDRLDLERRDDGFSYIVKQERTFLALSGTATIQNHHFAVRREVD